MIANTLLDNHQVWPLDGSGASTTAFYSPRVPGRCSMCEPRTLFHPFTMPIHFYESRCDWNMEWYPAALPLLRSTAMERRLPLLADAAWGTCTPHGAADSVSFSLFPPPWGARFYTGIAA